MDEKSHKPKENNSVPMDIPGDSVTRFRKPLVDYLVSGLEVNDKWVRIFSADMLAHVGDPRAAEYLKPLLVDRDQDLRMISTHAIELILSRHSVVSRPQDQCESCMIRLIAEEALTQKKPDIYGTTPRDHREGMR
jgi:hypothetical protein